MDGITLSRELQELLNETSGSSYLDSKSTYDYLYEAAIQTVQRTNCLTTTQSVTTVAEQRDYYLNADFLKLYLKDNSNRNFVKYTDGDSNNYFIYPKDYDRIILADDDDSVDVPDGFCIRDAADLTAKTGTTTSTGTLSQGTSALNDTGAGFLVTNKIAAGDFVDNITDGSHGVVVTADSAIKLTCALFGGTNNYFTSADSYRVNQAKRFYLTLDPPPSTGSETITVYYVKKPAPVYSSYYSYQIPLSLKSGLVRYAAWLYKYRDREPNFGDGWYRFWDLVVRQYGREMNQATNKKGFRVNLIKR